MPGPHLLPIFGGFSQIVSIDGGTPHFRRLKYDLVYSPESMLWTQT